MSTWDAGAVYLTNYTTRQSLISNNVYYAYRDSRGYMWFATDKGISRFDGREFKNYTTLDGIGDNEVFGFYEDKAHRLWLYTYNGSPCYLRNDSVFNAGNDPLLRKMPVISFMNAIYSSDDTTLYIGYRFGDIVKVCGDSVTRVRQSPGKLEELTSISPFGGQLFVITGDSSFAILNDKIANATALPSRTRSKYQSGLLFLSDKDGIRTLCDGKTLCTYKNSEVSSDYVINMSNDKAGNIFVSTNKGLYIINPATGKKNSLFPGKRISNVAQDICGNYWVASFGNGVYCLNSELDNLHLIPNTQNATEYQNPSSQLFVWQADTLHHFRNGHFVTEILPFSFHNNYLPLYRDDSMLFFVKEGFTYVYHKREHTLARTPVGPKWVFPANNKYLFISNYYGSIYSLKIKKGKSVKQDSSILVSTITHAVRSSFDNKIYVVTNDSLYLVNEKRIGFKSVASLPEGRKAMNMVSVGSYVILLTNTSEIIVFNLAAGYRRTELSTKGISLYHLADLGDGRYIAHTNKGYYTVSFPGYRFPLLQKIEYPFRSDQLFNVYTSDNWLLCNVNGDYCVINRQLVNKRLERPVFNIKSITVNGRQYRMGNISVSNARRGDVHLEVSALHFNGSANSYQYRIYSDEGAGRWYRSRGSDLNILIPEHGRYRLQLRAITENNRVSPSIFLTIWLKPPFYYSSWFKAIAVVILIAGVLYSIYLYNRMRRKNFQKKFDYLKMEHRALNSLLNPHFTFNAINNIQNLVNEKDNDKANEYLAVLSKLIRQNMENLRFSLVPIEKELTLVSNYIYLQNLRFDNRIKLVISNQLQEVQDINIPPLLIHTFVENAVVHGFDRKTSDFVIAIDISLSVDDYIIISIRDNGVGMAGSQKDYSHLPGKTSMGIDVTRTRLERLSKFYKVDYSIDILDKPDANTGTEVIITLYSKFREAVL